MKMLRYKRVEDIITISKKDGRLYIEIETSPESLFPINFYLNILEITELKDFLKNNF